MRLRFPGKKLMRAALLGMAAPLIFVAATCATEAIGGLDSNVPRTVESAGAGAKAAHAQGSAEVQYLLAWITATADNGSREFVVIDKKNATAHVFNATRTWRASSPVLIGLAVGDDTVPGVGNRPVSLVLSHERTTPAGRFVAELGINTQGESVVWVDYDAAVSMHSVRTTNASEQRLRRLASAQVEEHRISYGCINFPDAFFKAQVLPRFSHQNALVYVLPDSKTIDSVFDSWAVGDEASAAAATALTDKK